MLKTVIAVSFSLLFIMASMAESAIHNVSACTKAAFDTAHAAASNGDTLQFPTCTVTNWGAGGEISKSVHLKGNGKVGSVYNTKIRRNSSGGYIFRSSEGLQNFSISGMSLQGVTSGTTQTSGSGIEIRRGIDFAIYDNEIFNFSVGISVYGDPTIQRGVIYNNYFHDIYILNTMGYGVEVRGSGTYPALALGSSINIFIEDNTFERIRHSIESTDGARYVVRYNTIRDNRENAAAIDAHGNTNAYPRGSRQWEIYNNNISHPNVPIRFAGVGMRGGDGVIFNNVIDNLDKEIVMWNEDAGNEKPNGVDGCSASCTGCDCLYPCRDQTVDAHIWGNTKPGGGSVNQPKFKDPCHGTYYLQNPRDYQLVIRPNYTSYTYPHPLRTDPPSTPPGPPVNLAFTPIP